MYVTTNSAVVWKRVADESQHSAKILARVSAGLAILLVAIGAYAFSAHARYNDLCTTLETRSSTAAAKSARDFGQSIVSGYCG